MNCCKKNQCIDESNLNSAKLLEPQEIWLITIILAAVLYTCSNMGCFLPPASNPIVPVRCLTQDYLCSNPKYRSNWKQNPDQAGVSPQSSVREAACSRHHQLGPSNLSWCDGDFLGLHSAALPFWAFSLPAEASPHTTRGRWCYFPVTRRARTQKFKAVLH